MIGTTIVPYNLFLHASAAAESYKGDETIQAVAHSDWDTAISVSLGGLVTAAILLSASSAFHDQGQSWTSIDQISQQLAPGLGRFGSVTFAIGLFSAGLTSAITAPLATAYAVCGSLGWRTNTSSPGFRWVAISVVGVGGFLAIVSGKSPALDDSIGPASTYLVAQASGELVILPAVRGGLVSTAGSFYVAVDDEELTIAANGSLQYGPLSASAAGVIVVDYDDGVTVDLQLTSGLELGILSFNGNAGLFGDISADPELELNVDGELRFLDSFVVNGEFVLSNQADAVVVQAAGNMNIFAGTSVAIDTSFNIVKGDNPGLVFRSDIDLNKTLIVADVFEANANAQIQFNTRQPGALDEFDVGVPRDSLKIEISNASVNLLSAVTFAGSGVIERRDGVFRADVTMGANFLGGVAGLQARGFFSSEGEFLVDLDGQINLGAGGFGIFGDAAVTISRLDGNGVEPNGDQNFTIDANGLARASLKAFGQTVVGLGLEVDYDQADGEVSVLADVTVGPFSVNETFTIGFLQAPPVPQSG